MNFKDTPSPPVAPDPYAVASAQSGLNEDTARLQQKLNLINQNTPLGNISYTQGAGGDPDRWQSDVTLTPAGQTSFDTQQQVQKALSGLALSGTSQVGNTLGTPLSTSGLPAVKGTLGLPSFDTSGLPNAPKSLDLSSLGAAPKPTDYSSLTQVPGSIDLSKAGAMPSGLDFSSLGALPQFDTGQLNKATDAAYALQTSKLDPQYAQDRIKLEDRLINSGLAKGTPLYDQEVGNWERSRADAYQNARNSSIGQGLQYGTTLFGTQLAGRQQGASELSQALAAAMGIRQQGISEAEAQADQATQAHAVGATELQNRSQQELALRQQAEAEQQAQFGAGQSAYQQQLASMLAQRGQQTQEAQAESAQALAARQQGFQEDAYLRSLPLNEVAALLGTGQVGMPSFNAPPSTSVAPTNLSGDVYQSANLNQQNYLQQLQNQQASLGGLFSLGGALGSAALLA